MHVHVALCTQSPQWSCQSSCVWLGWKGTGMHPMAIASSIAARYGVSPGGMRQNVAFAYRERNCGLMV